MHKIEVTFFSQIAWLLLIKLCLIIIIRYTFFSHPQAKTDGIAATSAHLLGASMPAAKTVNNKLPEAP